ncbi:zinc finger protein 99 [Nothobranchius furzeri]|uniref:zinc finger protein 99 n=1 Tax=Nothobranchius furzeri TaxID=105023 RepID=UPI003904A4B1
MEGSSAATVREHGDDKGFRNNPSTEDYAEGVGVFCCRDYGAAFSEEAFCEEQHNHHQQNMYSDNQSDGQPAAEKDDETTYFCTLCSLSFIEMSELHLHMKNHNQMAQNSEFVNSGLKRQQNYKCSDCGKSYTSIGHLLNHVRAHKQPSKSLFHNLEQLKKKSFQCESCGRNYSRASALDAHRRCHEEKLVKSKSKSCEDLLKTGESEVETKSSESHPEDDLEKSFKCICGKAFSTVSRLKTHQRFSHNCQCAQEKTKQKAKKNSNEFYCSECKKGFNSHIALFSHQRSHSNPTNSTKRFPCEECGKVFKTLTFYYRHMRTAHSDTTPAKSFHHQVCQVQKKAFECKPCGLKFSRASALHSHQLQHTNAFRETEKSDQTDSTLLLQESGCKEMEHSGASLEVKVKSECVPATCVVEELDVNEAYEDVESYEPGDFNVQVISASDSESEDEGSEDAKPDLELLCESDQDVTDYSDNETNPDSPRSIPRMDLKIVQIDLDQSGKQCSMMKSEDGNKGPEERHDCPDCYRWFNNPASLRVHRMWHGIRMRRQQAQGQSVAVYTCETSYNEVQINDDPSSSNHLYKQADGLQKKTFTCNECGDVFPHLSALVSHQLHHPKAKELKCPECMMSFLHAASLLTHLTTCTSQTTENISVSKKEYNPKKTLLGPKIYHCEPCGKGFWSLGAYSHHKQNQVECNDLRLRKGLSGSLHVANGRSRSGVKVACPVCGRKFRHKGIMTLHMRKHENGNHKCEICNRSFRLFSSLLRHEVVHSDQLLPPPVKSFQHQVEQLKKNTYSCPDCGKLFSRGKALQFHMKSHGYESRNSPQSTANAKDLQCPTCLAHFNNKLSLRVHQKLCIKKDHEAGVRAGPSDQINEQTDVKNEDEHKDSCIKSPKSLHLKYKCKTCDKSFAAAGALNLHKRIHVEGVKSVAKSNIGLPLMIEEAKKEEAGKGQIHCSDCGRQFMTKSALGSHRRWHREKKCSLSSIKEEDLKSSGYKTEERSFQCKKCEKVFFNHRVLQRHQIFNPQCQTEPEPGSHSSVKRNGTPEQSSSPICNETFENVSHLASDYNPGYIDASSLSGNKVLSTAVKSQGHVCPLCFMTFAKLRGLRAHKWQAHSNSETQPVLTVETEPSDSSSEVNKTEDSVTDKNSSVDQGQKNIDVDPQPVKHISCLDCGKQCSSTAMFLDHKKVCSVLKQESKLEIKTPDATAEAPPPLSRVSEHPPKYLFKCDKCGKAFQTEKQLAYHKKKAKSRPHCCALCCHGFWTEIQLQQHLTWHDEVRCRLPNEVRFRLSAALISKPFKPNSPNSCITTNQPPLSSSSQSQSEH